MAAPMSKDRRFKKPVKKVKKMVSKQKKIESLKGEEVELDIIQDLGGDEDDYKMLHALDDDQESLEDVHGDKEMDVEENELKTFMQSLGFDDVNREKKKSDTKKSSTETEKSGIKDTKSKAKTKSVDGDKTSKGKKVSDVQHPEVSSTTLSTAVSTNKDVHGKKYLVQPGGKWLDESFENDPVVSTDISSQLVEKYRVMAEKLFHNDVSLYTEKKSEDTSGSSAWIQTVISSGTLGDKIAALSSMVQNSPIHNAPKLDTMINMCKKKGRREALMAMESLKDLWLSELLPDNRKLRKFSRHPFDQLSKITGGNKTAKNKRLLLWYFEDLLKKKYEEYLEAVKLLSHDTVAAVKSSALSAIYELLVQKPEQEKYLLSQLVNKVGDPDYKIAARTSHLLGKLVAAHPQMKLVVAEEVETVLYRPNIGVKAQYYAVCFLNQFVLSHDEPELAAKLISIYFAFFNAFVKKKEIDGKMLSALLTGVNRAYPFAKVDDETVNAQMDTIFRVIHIAPFQTGLQALMLLHQVMDARQAMSDRYYMALYKKLADSELKNSPKQEMFLNLLFKSLKADMVLQRVKAFVKRLLQVCSCQQPSFVCASLFLVSELFRLKDGLKALSRVADYLEDYGDDDEEEHFKDETDSDNAVSEDEPEENPNPSVSSWVHHKLAQGSDEKSKYDAMNRNPLYCGAECSILWELKKLAGHYHPSVSHFANTLLNDQYVRYTGNPLQDFTLIRFLDRFVYRNPKKTITERVSVMQPKSKSYQPSGVRSLLVNSEEFMQKAESEVPLDEVFFHRYFSKKEEKKKVVVKGDIEDEDSDASSVEDEEFDEYLDELETGEIGVDKNVDFASEFSRSKGKKKQKKAADDDDGDSSDFDDEDDADIDDDSDFDLDEEFKLDDDDELDEENFGGGEKEDFDDVPLQRKTEKKKKTKQSDRASVTKKGEKKHEGVRSDLLSTAEELAGMMDENIGAKFDNIGVNAMANKDKAAEKQLKWEMERDLWVRGVDYKTKRKRGFKSKGKFGNQSQNKKKFKRK